MNTYEEQIAATLKSTYDDGVKHGKSLGMTELHVKILEAANSVNGFNVKYDLLRMINELKAVMTSEQYDTEAKADHRTSEQFPNV